jgi:hypothetical protein
MAASWFAIVAQTVADLRPSRLDINALLDGSTLDRTKRQAIVDALEAHGLLFGRETPIDAPSDPSGRLSRAELTLALAQFDEQSRASVLSLLSQVGALA